MPVVWAGNTCPHYKTKEMSLLWGFIMNKDNKEYLKLYLQGIFKCETTINDIVSVTGKLQCTSICCKFADSLYIRVDLSNEEVAKNFLVLEAIDRNKFNIALKIYQELVLMRVRSLCNVELGYFSNLITTDTASV